MSCAKCSPWIERALEDGPPFPSGEDVVDTGHRTKVPMDPELTAAISSGDPGAGIIVATPGDLSGPYSETLYVLQCLHCGAVWDSKAPVDEDRAVETIQDLKNANQCVAIVTGSRNWSKPEIIYAVLDRLLEECIDNGRELVLRIGDCKTGADVISEQWAVDRHVTTHTYVANWEHHQFAAGPIRNTEMVVDGGEVCLAFWDCKLKNSGTLDCYSKAIAAGIRTEVYGEQYSPRELQQ